jgi:hypothetical protein
VNDPTVFRRDCFKPNCATTLFNQRDSAVYSGSAVLEHVTTLMRGLSQVLTAYGTATEEEISIDTFTERVSCELGPDPVLVSGPDLAVWASKP